MIFWLKSTFSFRGETNVFDALLFERPEPAQSQRKIIVWLPEIQNYPFAPPGDPEGIYDRTQCSEYIRII